MDRQLESQLLNYFKQCKSYETKGQCVEKSELRQLCRYYEPYGLSYRDCIERVPLDNKGYIDFSSFCEYVQDNYHYPSTRTNGYLDTSGPRRLASPSARGQTSSVHPTYNMSRSLRDIHGSRSGLLDATDSYYPGTTESPLPSSRRQRTPHEDFYSPPDTEMDTPRPHQRDPTSSSKPHDYHLHHFQHSWQRPTIDSPPPPNVSTHWPHPEDSDAEDQGINYAHLTMRPCHQCKQLQLHVQRLEDEVVGAKQARDRHELWLEKERQQSMEYYNQLQILIDKAARDKDRYKSELKRVRDEHHDSDSSRGHYDRHYEDLKHNKEELELSLKRYRKCTSALKDENERLKIRLQELERRNWRLIDEQQQLQCRLFSEDSLLSRVPGEGTSHPSTPFSRCMNKPSILADDLPERDVTPSHQQKKGKSVASAPSELSDGSHPLSSSVPGDQNHTFIVLGDNVNTRVFPDHLSQEHQLQIVCALQNCASVQELVRCLLSYGVSPQEDKSTAYHSENELLRSRVKHLEAKLQTLTGSFENAKLESEAMFEKLSKVEANNVRLRHATRQCQQAYEIQELLCELRLVDGRVGDTTSSYAMPNFDSPSRSPDRDLSGVRHILLSRARTLLHTLESSKEELQSFQPSSQSDTGSLMLGRTLTLSVTSGFNSCGSESELASNEIDRLRSFSQALLGQSSHLIGSIEEIDGLKQLHCVKQPSVTKDTGVGSDGGRVTDMEENTNTEELCKVREEKAELKSQIYTMEQSKRSMELQFSQMQLHGRMMERAYSDIQLIYQNERRSRKKYKEKLKMLKAENPHVPDWLDQSAELQAANDREKEAYRRYEELYAFLHHHIQHSQSISDQLVEFVRELLQANRALVEAFERAKKRQQVEKKHMRHELLQYMNRHERTYSAMQLQPPT